MKKLELIDAVKEADYVPFSGKIIGVEPSLLNDRHNREQPMPNFEISIKPTTLYDSVYYSPVNGDHLKRIIPKNDENYLIKVFSNTPITNFEKDKLTKIKIGSPINGKLMKGGDRERRIFYCLLMDEDNKTHPLHLKSGQEPAQLEFYFQRRFPSSERLFKAFYKAIKGTGDIKYEENKFSKLVETLLEERIFYDDIYNFFRDYPKTEIISPTDYSYLNNLSKDKKTAGNILGITLQKMIGKCNEKNIKLDFREINKVGIKLDDLRLEGEENIANVKRKKFKIYGDVGDCLSGSNAEINVFGNVGNRLGEFGYNLDIIVHGNVGEEVCYDASETKININGNFKSLSEVVHRGDFVVTVNTPNENRKITEKSLSGKPERVSKEVVKVYQHGKRVRKPIKVDRIAEGLC